MQNKSDLAWNLFVEARKEILENQKIRTQIIGFKITSISAGVGLIAANIDKIPAIVLVVPAFAAVFFDLLITSYSFAIKRTGYYCYNHIEPILRETYNWPKNYFLWEEFMRRPHARQRLAFRGNIGMTVLAIAPAIYVLLFLPSPLRIWVSGLLVVLLILLLAYDIWIYSLPSRFFPSTERREKEGRDLPASAQRVKN